MSLYEYMPKRTGCEIIQFTEDTKNKLEELLTEYKLNYYLMPGYILVYIPGQKYGRGMRKIELNDYVIFDSYRLVAIGADGV